MFVLLYTCSMYFSPSCGLFCNLFTYRITYINSSSQKFVIPKGLLSWKLKKVIRYPKLSFQKVTCRYLYRLLVLDTVKRNNLLTPSTFLQNRVGQKLLRSREGLLSEYRTSNKSLMLCKQVCNYRARRLTTDQEQTKQALTPAIII